MKKLITNKLSILFLVVLVTFILLFLTIPAVQAYVGQVCGSMWDCDVCEFCPSSKQCALQNPGEDIRDDCTDFPVVWSGSTYWNEGACNGVGTCVNEVCDNDIDDNFRNGPDEWCGHLEDKCDSGNDWTCSADPCLKCGYFSGVYRCEYQYFGQDILGQCPDETGIVWGERTYTRYNMCDGAGNCAPEVCDDNIDNNNYEQVDEWCGHLGDKCAYDNPYYLCSADICLECVTPGICGFQSFGYDRLNQCPNDEVIWGTQTYYRYGFCDGNGGCIIELCDNNIDDDNNGWVDEYCGKINDACDDFNQATCTGEPCLICSSLTATCQQDPACQCGDGNIDPGEQCDDGNANNNDACKNDCSLNVCGDGVVNVGVEECDDGDQNNCNGCNNNCKKPDLLIDKLEVIQVLPDTWHVENKPVMFRVYGKLVDEQCEKLKVDVKVEVNGPDVYTEIKNEEIKKSYSDIERKKGENSVNFFPNNLFKKKGAYQIKATIDSTAKIDETNEANNEKIENVNVGEQTKEISFDALRVTAWVGDPITGYVEYTTKDWKSIFNEQIRFIKKSFPVDSSKIKINILKGMEAKTSWEARKKERENILRDLEKFIRHKYGNTAPGINTIAAFVPQELIEKPDKFGNIKSWEGEYHLTSPHAVLVKANTYQLAGENTLAHEYGHVLGLYVTNGLAGEQYNLVPTYGEISDDGWCLTPEWKSCNARININKEKVNIKGRQGYTSDKDRNEITTGNDMGKRYFDIMGVAFSMDLKQNWMYKASYENIKNQLTKIGVLG